jgi:hypothetical protein
MSTHISAEKPSFMPKGFNATPTGDPYAGVCPGFFILSGCCSETEIPEQLYLMDFFSFFADVSIISITSS